MIYGSFTLLTFIVSSTSVELFFQPKSLTVQQIISISMCKAFIFLMSSSIFEVVGLDVKALFFSLVCYWLLRRWFWLLQIWLEQIQLSIWAFCNIFGECFLSTACSCLCQNTSIWNITAGIILSPGIGFLILSTGIREHRISHVS